jgi:hypothetical protein
MNKEKIEHHIKHLQEKHSQVNKQLTTLLAHGHYTDTEITELKKKKLHIKDEIESLKQRMA